MRRGENRRGPSPGRADGERACHPLLQEARAALERRDFEGAERAIAQVLAEDPEAWEAHHLYGVLMARRQAWSEAEAAFRRAHALNPTHPAPVTNLANTLTERGRYEEAIALYQQALELDPHHSNAHHNLGVAYRRLGRFSESVHHLKQAQRLEAGLAGPGSAAGGAGRLLLWLLLALLAAFALWR